MIARLVCLSVGLQAKPFGIPLLHRASAPDHREMSTAVKEMDFDARRIVPRRAPEACRTAHFEASVSAAPTAVVDRRPVGNARVQGVRSQCPVNAVYKRLARSRTAGCSLIVTAASTEGDELNRCQIVSHETGGHGFDSPGFQSSRQEAKSAVLP